MLRHPDIAGQPAFVVLDEPFRFVSREYRPAIAELVKELSEELNVQFVLVTHSSEFEIGKVVDVT